jgi:hypothetical protein
MRNAGSKEADTANRAVITERRKYFNRSENQSAETHRGPAEQLFRGQRS